MKPLPRLLAFVDDRIAALEDLGVRAAAIAAAGPAAGLVARLPHGTPNGLSLLAERLIALSTPPMACTLVSGRADIALTTRADGVVLRRDDLPVDVVRRVARPDQAGTPARALMVLRSIHSLAEARVAVDEGADAVIAGPVWDTPTHPDRTPAGTAFLSDVVALGLPVYAIGGVTLERAAWARDAGAWGVAAIRALWDADRPYDAANRLIRAMGSEATQ